MNIINEFSEERECTYKGEVYSVRDNGAIMRHAKNPLKPRQLDNAWTFGKICPQKGYLMSSSEVVHRIVAVAFLGEAPSKEYVVDHIDTNRQNNRTENLRWVTRLENILLNPITTKKLELACGCSIEEVLNNISILKDKNLPVECKWMRTVTVEEAKQTLSHWMEWVNNKTIEKRTDVSKKNYYNFTKNTEMVYPLEPAGVNLSLKKYYDNLSINKEFCYRYCNNEKNSYIIIDYYFNEDTNKLSVATINDKSPKSYYLTSITFDNEYHYEVDSYFQEDGLKKYMTLARGEEWAGGDVFDDYC